MNVQLVEILGFESWAAKYGPFDVVIDPIFILNCLENYLFISGRWLTYLCPSTNQRAQSCSLREALYARDWSSVALKLHYPPGRAARRFVWVGYWQRDVLDSVE